ncbi:MAG: hypothetical protein ACTSVB_10985 [Candidatus Heimdallarchaeaceae archaeon]
MIVDFGTRNKKIKALFKIIKEEKIFSESLENEVISLFGDRGEKAIKILKNKRLVKLKIKSNLCFWIVKGKNSDYVIIDTLYCDCRDFYMRIINRNNDEPCYHLLAKIIGEKLNLYQEQEMGEIEYNSLIYNLYYK